MTISRSAATSPRSPSPLIIDLAAGIAEGSRSASAPAASAKGKGKLKASHHLSSGALSGFTSAVILQPLDLLKTRLQQSYGPNEGKKRKLRPVVRQILTEDGVPGLWRGTIPTIVRNVPGVALYFYTLSTIREELSHIPYFATALPPAPVAIDAAVATAPRAMIPDAPGTIRGEAKAGNTALVKISSQGNLVAGAIARTSVGFMLNPITVLKARYESSRYTAYRSMPSAFLDLLRTGGIRGLFQGFTATAARDAPYAGLYLVIYEKSKDLAGRLCKPEWGIPNAAQHSASGAMAAGIATLLTSPADCVKTRMQVDPVEHPTLRKAIARIHGDRGFAGFFSGASLRISRKAASSAIAWTVYEGLLLFLRDR